MSADETKKEDPRFISVETLLAALVDYPEAQMLVKIIEPFLPLILREGEVAFANFVTYASEGNWQELDRTMWEKMTEDERDHLSNKILADAREEVDIQFQRKKEAREIAIRITTSLLLGIL